MGVRHWSGGLLWSIAAGMGFAAIPPPPAAPVEPVVDDYFGTPVTDNYRWMEHRGAPRFVQLNDPRVAPWQPGKMTARLQATTGSERPVLLLADFGAGHGMGSIRSQRDQEFADQPAFFYRQIGQADYQPPAGSVAEEFETPPEQAPASLLTAEAAAGPSFRVEDPVRSDGLMRHFVLDGRYGKFDAYGRVELELRIREVAALDQLEKISPLDVVAGSVGNSVMAQVNTITDVAKRPVQTIAGIPRGITHLFHGVVAESKEAVADAKGSAADPGQGAGQKRSSIDKGEAAAKQYADRYFGLSAADRRWYKKLGLDPYTSNDIVRRAVHKDAKLDATATFGLKFAALPAIAGLGIARRAMDAIYNEDPAVLRARQRKELAALGLTPAEVAHWQNNLSLSPTRQTLLLEAVQALNGVAGRDELLRHAMNLTSDTEAGVYLRSVGLLVVAHRQAPIAAVLPGVRLPAARLTDGRIIVCGAFDAVYWTSDVESGERAIRDSLSAVDAAAARELWLEGSISDMARRSLEKRGWRIHETAGLSAAYQAVGGGFLGRRS